jgi:hypothetical protein
MGERGRAHVVARHSRDSMVDGTLAVYEEAMA